jgi:hypothetical protein
VEVTNVVEGKTVVETIVQTVEVEKEVQVEVTPTPSTSEADRKGGWLDMIVFIEEPSDQAAITRLDAGEMDVYAYDIANPDIYQTVQGMDNLAYTFAYGSYRELTMNPAQPGAPHSSPAWRWAANRCARQPAGALTMAPAPPFPGWPSTRLSGRWPTWRWICTACPPI